MGKSNVNLGIRVSEKTKKQVEELIESARKAGEIDLNGEIVDLLLQNYDQTQMKKKVAYGADFKELNQITRRINSIFSNLAKRNETNLETIKRKHLVESGKLQNVINVLKEKNEEFEEELTIKNSELDELTELKKVNELRIEELEQMSQSSSERIEEQKTAIADKDEVINDKNRVISEKIEEISGMEKDIEENEALREELEGLRGQVVSDAEEFAREKEKLELDSARKLFAAEQKHAKEKQDALAEAREKYESLYDDSNALKEKTYQQESQLLSKDAEIEELKHQLEEQKKKHEQDNE